MNTIYIYDDNGYYLGEIEKQAGVIYNNYMLEAPDFETNSPDRYLAKVNLKTKSKVWEYEVKPEILEKEKEEREKLEAEQRQKEYEEKQKEKDKNKPDSLVFQTKAKDVKSYVIQRI